MTDRYKGFLVLLENDIRSDNAKPILEALKMIKGVLSVKPYVAHMEDYLLAERERIAISQKMNKFIAKELLNLKLEEK